MFRGYMRGKWRSPLEEGISDLEESIWLAREVEDDALPLSLYDQLAAWAAPLDVEVVDMARHWRAVGHKPGRFLPRDAVHPTALGYREVVDALVETQALGPGQD